MRRFEKGTTYIVSTKKEDNPDVDNKKRPIGFVGQGFVASSEATATHKESPSQIGFTSTNEAEQPENDSKNFESNRRYQEILEAKALEFLKNNDPAYFNREFTGELDSQGYLIRKDGHQPTTKPSMNIGGGKPLETVMNQARAEYQKQDVVKSSADKNADVSGKKEAKKEIKNPEQLQAQKHYLELRQDYARLIENQNALFALAGLPVEEAGESYLEDVTRFLKGVHREAVQLGKELNSLEQGTDLPRRLVNTGAMDKEFFDEQLNKVKQNLGEPIVERKPKIKIFLRPEEYEMIKNNFPRGLFKRGTEVKYDGDQWLVAGYDGYTGRAILKANLGDGKMEYTFADRVDLYLENRPTNRDLEEARKSTTEAAEQNGLSPKACIEMSGDDHFDYERDLAEREARKTEKLTTQFKEWAKKSYEKFKKEIGSLPQDIRDIIEVEREPFKATIRDNLKDLKTAKEKVGRWFEGRGRAMAEAWSDIKRANDFRAASKEIAEGFTKWNEFFEEEAVLRRWVDSEFDPMVVDDKTLEDFYSRVDKVREAVGAELPKTKKDKKEMFHLVFDDVLKVKISVRDKIQEDIVTKETEKLREKLVDINPALRYDQEEIEGRLEVFKEELNKEFGRLRQFQTAIDTKKMAALIRSLLDKDYWKDYVYGPLKVLQPNKEK